MPRDDGLVARVRNVSDEAHGRLQY